MKHKVNWLGFHPNFLIYLFFLFAKPRKYITYLFSIILLNTSVFAQSGGSDSLILKSGLKSNSAASYSGNLEFSLPLYQIKSKGMSIPVALNYNSTGFKPNSPVGTMGLNWSLAAQGQITRKVNDIPDDHQGVCSSNYPTGYYVGTKNSNQNIDDQIFNFSYPSTYNCENYNPGYEYSPDEFSFNCLGHSGKFYITNGGKVKVISTENITVDITGLTIQDPKNLAPAPSSITLTTSDGYKFYFGGELKHLDYIISMSQADRLQGGGAIIAWHLTKVVAPDNRVIDFVYKDFQSSISEVNIGRYYSHHYTFNAYLNSEKYYLKMSGALGGIPIPDIVLKDTPAENKDTYRIIKQAYLEKIESADFKLLFNYTEDQRNFYADNNGNRYFGSLNNQNFSLKDISLFNSENSLIKKFDFKYEYLGGQYGNRKFLTRVSESGKGNYGFDYYRTKELPGVLVRNIDHWGFWKGGYNESAILIPEVTQNLMTGDQTILSSSRNPDGSFCNVGMLQNVNFPSGGKSSFVYESHDYSKRLERRNISSFLPAVYDVNGMTGGSRIKEIRDSSSVGNVVTRRIFYRNNFITGGTTSSGILLDWPRYIFEVSYTSRLNYDRRQQQGSSFNLNYNPDEPFVNYSEVTMATIGNGYEIVKFTNYLSNPDTQDFNTKYVPDLYPVHFSNQTLYNNYNGLIFNDRSMERAKLNFQGYYDENLKLIKSKSLKYNSLPSTDYIVSTRATNRSLVQSYKIYTSPSRVVEITELTNTIPAITQVQNFSYDANFHNLIQQSATLNGGMTLSKRYLYPTDYLQGTGFIDKMKTSGATGLPVEVVVTQTNDNKESILGGQLIQYWPDGSGKPEVIYNLELDAPIPSASFKFSNKVLGSSPSSIGNPQLFGKDTRYKSTFNYIDYGQFGNPIEVIPNSITKGISTSYQWGYGGQHIVAEVKNSRIRGFINEFYFTNFEDDLDGFQMINKDSTTVHTGKFSCRIDAYGEDSYYNRGMVFLKPGKARQITYSGWFYSNGPSAGIKIYMFNENGEQISEDKVMGDELGKWKYLVKTVSVPDDIWNLRFSLEAGSAGTIYFDDIGIRPSNAELTSYTYKPMVGPTSKIESNGTTSYYEYDQANRLLIIKDQNGNIKQHNTYHNKP